MVYHREQLQTCNFDAYSYNGILMCIASVRSNPPYLGSNLLIPFTTSNLEQSDFFPFPPIFDINSTTYYSG